MKIRTVRRRIIQFEMSRNRDGSTKEIFALDDHGTLWRTNPELPGRWYIMEDLPERVVPPPPPVPSTRDE